MNTYVVNTREARDALLDKELDELVKQRDNPEDTDKNAAPPNGEDKTDWKKRYSDARSYYDKRENDLKKQLAEREKALAEAAKPKIPVNKEEYEAWKREFPDALNNFEQFIMEKVPAVTGDIQQKLAEIEEERHSLKREREMNVLLKIHPDFFDIKDTKEFRDWFEQKRLTGGMVGQSIYDAVFVNDTDGKAAAEAISVYKEMTNKKKKEPRQTDTSAAFSVRTAATQQPPKNFGDKPTFTLSQIDKMSDRDFEKYEKDIDEARREGRIIDDVGAAF